MLESHYLGFGMAVEFFSYVTLDKLFDLFVPRLPHV